MKTLKVKVCKGTWVAGTGVSTTYHLDKRPFGLRVHEFAIEGKPTVVSLIEGDGRTAKFKVHCAGEL